MKEGFYTIIEDMKTLARLEQNQLQKVQKGSKIPFPQNLTAETQRTQRLRRVFKNFSPLRYLSELCAFAVKRIVKVLCPTFDPFEWG